MKLYSAEHIRNVALVGHGGAGKTSLAEAMLFDSGAISRLGRVDEGTTTTDHDPDEIKRKMSINTSLAPCEWQDTKVNVIDVPGYTDFIGELKASLRVNDATVVVFDAVGGVEVGSEVAWQNAEHSNLPRLAFVNKMERENADFARVVDAIRQRFGSRAVPLQLPIGSEHAFAGVVDLVSMKALTFAGGSNTKIEEGEVPADLADTAAQAREQLVEAVAEINDDLITKYLEGEELSEEEIRDGLRQSVLAGKLVPILCGSAHANKGMQPLLDAIVAYLPSPLEAPTSEEDAAQLKKAGGALAALVFKTMADPYVGKLTYFRVYSGSFKSDSHIYNANRQRDERVGTLLCVRGKAQEAVAEVPAGDVGAVAKLQETVTGDTLCTKEHPVQLSGIPFPSPVFAAAIEPKTKADLDKLSAALQRIIEEDPTVHVTKDQSTGQALLSGMGESHTEIIIDRMQRKFGVAVNVSLPKVPYKETVTSGTKVQGRFKRQTGGHGQFGDVWIELEPNREGDFEFVNKIVGGVVPRQYIPAVEKGVREAMEEGVLAHYPVTGIRVTLYDGSYHPVDSSEMAFKIAGSMAFKKAATEAHPVLLEPIMRLTITVPEQFMGDVIGDLNSKRARVLGMEPRGDGYQVIQAEAPLAEVQRYATDLRSMTQARGMHQMEFARYEEVPPHLAARIIEEAKKEREEK